MGDGSEEVVACAWDGHTYLVNLNKEVVRFKFRENVAAFCAGHYAIEKEVNVPCLFYVTFNNRIVVYYKINMPNIANMTLTETMEQQQGLDELLRSFNCDVSSPSQVSQLYNWCLYGFHPKKTG
ncbi:hypothetical protein LSH36_1181g00001 [Paralvinella palmiformis]|uniref:Uncharacterized protein n=1 Tax=Paralvinella palmiformis TaxID=53620 RepID=A0AAD9IUY4_9ANNE|nr:hypothetical protein LSH36_1181g00001 [Paralvinella palmiformis]